MARAVIQTKVYGDDQKELGEDAMYSLMSCTNVYSFMALTAFVSSHLHKLWDEPNSKFKEEFSQYDSFEKLMETEFRELKKSLNELAKQSNIKPLHQAKPEAWRKLNELLKGYRDFFIHPHPEKFSEQLDATGNLPWNFASNLAEEIIEYFFVATGSKVPPWLSTPGLKSKGFEVVSIQETTQEGEV